jgi:hypothetical protein
MHAISATSFLFDLFTENINMSQVFQNTHDGEFMISRNHSLYQIHDNSHEAPTIQECIKWINSPDPSVNYNAAHEKMTKDTGKWLMQDQRLMNWKKNNGGLLWLQGKGKMVLVILLYNNQYFYIFLAGSGKTFLL